MSRNKNVLRRVAIVQGIMEQHYEEGNQSKCQVQVLRNVLMKSHPMSERTLRRYMKIDVEKELGELKPNVPDGQLFFDFD